MYYQNPNLLSVSNSPFMQRTVLADDSNVFCHDLECSLSHFMVHDYRRTKGSAFDNVHSTVIHVHNFRGVHLL